jgi:hypothetical protein
MPKDYSIAYFMILSMKVLVPNEAVEKAVPNTIFVTAQ